MGDSMARSVCWEDPTHSEDNVTTSMTRSIGLDEPTPTRTCFECTSPIFNCYSVCSTCHSLGEDYWLCDQCSDRPTHRHNPRHVFETVFQYENALPIEAIS